VQLVLKFRNMLPTVIREELDSLVASINGFWAVEHNPDGTHRDIHASSVTINGVPVGTGGGGLPLTTKGDLVANDGTTNVRVPVGSTGRVLTADPSASPGVSWQIPAVAPAITRAITCVIDGGGVAITTGIKADVTVPYAATVTAWTLLADQAGSAVVDVWSDLYGSYPPTLADTMPGATPPTLSGAKATGGVGGWTTTTIAAGNTLRFSVISAATITRLTLTLTVTT
jgi:hypothetical protein